MITLYTIDEFNNASLTDPLKLKCEFCHKEFYLQKKFVKSELKRNVGRNKYCSRTCAFNSKITQITVECLNCKTYFTKKKSDFLRSKNHFCSRKCSGIYNSTHKKFGSNRSKLELYIEQQLKSLYPNLEILYNYKQAILSELDIYIPSLKLAFELNGIFHYEPVFGQSKLKYIQNNDCNKFKQCHENNISLCVIDTSKIKHFKEKNAFQFINIITSIIEERLLTI